MKRAIKQQDNITTYRIDSEWYRYDEETVKAKDFHCQAVVHILQENSEWYILDLFDPETNSFNF